MKSVCYFLCGVFMTLTMIVFIIDFWGREFIQDYWIEQLWYGELKLLYKAITTIIMFIDCLLLYIIGLIYFSKQIRKRKIVQTFKNHYQK